MFSITWSTANPNSILLQVDTTVVLKDTLVLVIKQFLKFRLKEDNNS